MDFIIADCDGNEVGILEERQYIDIDIGNNNDFEIHVSRSFYHSSGIREGYRICVVGQEYGGIIDKIKSVSEEQEIILSGRTWRGLLTQKIIIPPEEQDYKIAYGDAHQIINEIVCNSFEGLFKCEGKSNIIIDNYKFDRYTDALAGIEKMLLEKSARIHIAYNSGESDAPGYIELSAVPIHDYSDEIEYSKEGTVSVLSFSFEKYSGGINHLICLGKGNLKERLVIHLYVQEDGSIGDRPYYKGKDERSSVYDYSSTESAEELQKKGIEQLKKMMSYTNMDIDLNNQNLADLDGYGKDIDIGDKVGGRDAASGIYLSKQIARKIIQVKDGNESISYKVGGNTMTRSTATAPEEPQDSCQKQIDALNESLMNIGKVVFPVGSVFVTTVNQNPSTFLGGTWAAWGAGRVPVGVNTNDSNFNAVEKTGGSATHTLTAAQMPTHNHAFTGSASTSGNNSATPTASFAGSAVNSGNQSVNHTHGFSGTTGQNGNHTHIMQVDWDTAHGGYGYSVHNAPTGGETTQTPLNTTGNHNHTISGTTGSNSASHTHKVTAAGKVTLSGTTHTHSVTAKGSIGNAGAGSAHNNLQPYITCYMWKRTA